MKITERLRTFPQRLWLLALIVLALIALALIWSEHGAITTASAQAVEPSPFASTEPALPPANAPDPFPTTDSMTETIQAVLADYEAAQSARGMAPIGPVEVKHGGGAVYLPLIRSQRSATPPPPTPTLAPMVKPADMATTIWPTPSIRVTRDGLLAYEIRLKNYGQGAASSQQVTLPYNNKQLTLTNSRFTTTNDWVSSVTTDRVVVSFGRIAAGEYRTATLYFRVDKTLVDNTVIDMRASHSWSDDGRGGSGRGNWAPILVGGSNDSASWVWQTVNPLGGYPGTKHQFFSDRFIPGEGIITWLNTPSGVRPLDLRGVADTMGRVTIDFSSSGLPAGTYSLVLYGARSNLTGVTTFYVW